MINEDNVKNYGFLKELDDRQREAILSESNQICVIDFQGYRKIETLTYRFIY